MSGYKHLTHEQRVLVEDRLNHKISIRKIAAELEKSPSTILREIKNHSTFIPTVNNDCKHRRNCDLKHLCVHENTCNAEDSHGNYIDFLDVYSEEQDIRDTLSALSDEEK